MRVLIIGSGAREHALADSFAQHIAASELAIAPGNAGIAREFQCLPLYSKEDILAWCRNEQPEMVVIGPEQPLAEGLADFLRSNQINCVGPSQAAARIETSKIFAKNLMLKHHIPTAKFAVFTNEAEALQYLAAQATFPIVIKADGLSAGKGVTVANDEPEALAAIHTALGKSKSGVVIEQFLHGWEVSLFAICDGANFQTTLFSQDHKQLYDGDTGPNTGGMGAYCPVLEAEPCRQQIEEEIISPVLQAMREEGCPFEGFLYCGLMITAEGPKVVEFNCRLGDPETQAMLPLLKTDLAEVCRAITSHRVGKLRLDWKDAYGICVVLASAGYPGSYQTDHPVLLSDDIKSSIYYSGVKDKNDALVTSGGRVLSLVSTGESITQAKDQVYTDVKNVDFIGKSYRRDISMRKNTL